MGTSLLLELIRISNPTRFEITVTYPTNFTQVCFIKLQGSTKSYFFNLCLGSKSFCAKKQNENNLILPYF